MTHPLYTRKKKQPAFFHCSYGIVLKPHMGMSQVMNSKTPAEIWASDLHKDLGHFFKTLDCFEDEHDDDDDDDDDDDEDD